MKSEPPPHPLGPSFSLSAHLFTFYHGGISKLSQIPLQPLWLTYSLSESEPFFPYWHSTSSTVSLDPSPSITRPSCRYPSTRRCDRSNRGDAGRERENKDKKETFQSSLVQTQSARVAPYRTRRHIHGIGWGGAREEEKKKRTLISLTDIPKRCTSESVSVLCDLISGASRAPTLLSLDPGGIG